jgi:hypothetical protein
MVNTVRSAKADRGQFTILFSAAADAPAAIQSWIRYGGSVYRRGLVRRGGPYSKTSTNVNW